MDSDEYLDNIRTELQMKDEPLFQYLRETFIAASNAARYLIDAGVLDSRTTPYFMRLSAIMEHIMHTQNGMLSMYNRKIYTLEEYIREIEKD
jgi:hypothetical protein